jgi:hypothetical protein
MQQELKAIQCETIANNHSFDSRELCLRTRLASQYYQALRILCQSKLFSGGEATASVTSAILRGLQEKMDVCGLVCVVVPRSTN